jgi:hypothetical protein
MVGVPLPVELRPAVTANLSSCDCNCCLCNSTPETGLWFNTAEDAHPPALLPLPLLLSCYYYLPLLLHHRRSFSRAPKLTQPCSLDRFIHNPHFTAPKASDFRPGPLHPRRIVPYQYASLYSHPSFPHPVPAPTPDHDRVPKQLKARLKKSRAAVALLETLEREVREFLYGEGLEGSDGEVSEGSDGDGEGMEIDGKFGEYREENREDYEESVDGDSGDEGEEEIVFVSRKERQQQNDGGMRERCVYHSEEGNEGGKFG